jgi:redox-sensitive bicupin YhaK (pirin superfamily)
MLERVIEARRHDLGGFEVGRVLPYRERRMVGPFIFLDHMGPVEMPAPVPQSSDVRPHPHIGLSTVTYLFDGEMTHRDSLGVEQVIEPGALNWMTAGAGITHSERFDGLRERGGCMDGIQSWVALPETNEEDPPAFDHYDAGDLPRFDDAGVSGRVIAGRAFGLASPARTHSPLFYVHAELAAGARLALPDGYAERAAFIARGEVELAGQRHQAGQMLVFAAGASPVLRARGATARVMLLGGDALGTRHIWWNFVSSRRERIEQAKADWVAGRFALPPHDHAEFIPLPDTPGPGANPMS